MASLGRARVTRLYDDLHAADLEVELFLKSLTDELINSVLYCLELRGFHPVIVIE